MSSAFRLYEMSVSRFLRRRSPDAVFDQSSVLLGRTAGHRRNTAEVLKGRKASSARQRRKSVRVKTTERRDGRVADGARAVEAAVHSRRLI